MTGSGLVYSPWRIGRRWCAMGSPASMRDADVTGRGIAGEHLDQIGELAFGPTSLEFPAIDNAQTRAVVAAIFHPPEAIDKPLGNGLLSDNSDNSAHSASF